MAPYGILDQADEDALHAARLLNVEEKLFKRLSKRLLAPDSLLNSLCDPSENTAARSSLKEQDTSVGSPDLKKERKQHILWRDEALLDFASYESNVLRTQFLFDSNEQERLRYATEKERILETAQRVRENNIFLQSQLADAQKTLALRKTYDDQARKIVDEPSLKSREEQHINIEKLQEEIAELERESEDYASTWVERREQFNKIFDAGEDLLRLIRDEKEEAERKEGMDDVEPDNGTPRAYASGTGTPKPADDATTLQDREMEHGDRSLLSTASKFPAAGMAEDSMRTDSISDIEDGEEQETEVMDTRT